VLVIALCAACTTTSAEQESTTPTPALDEARARYLASGTLDDAIWVGRQLGYLGRFAEAIEHYSSELARRGAEPHLLRHRGHRFISLRRFDEAINDLKSARVLAMGLATEIEPDGIPTPAGPRTTLQGNILYHLALAQFLDGQLEGARRSWQEAVQAAANDDDLVSALYWLTITMWEVGDASGAARALALVRTDWDVRENFTYAALLKLFAGVVTEAQWDAGPMYFGKDVDDATLGFGRAMFARHVQHDEKRARSLLTETVRLPARSAFGFIAAEAVLARASASDLPVAPDARKRP